MRISSTDAPRALHPEQFDPHLVEAARDGDPQAREELLAASLPLVHTLVQRSLPAGTDTSDGDDVVQDTLLAALRDLPSLHNPTGYRSWLTVITVRQIGAHVRRRRSERPNVVDLRAAETLPLPDLDLDEHADVDRELSRQRRQVARAGLWLDPDDRVLLSLWWLETAGNLTRSDLADAIGVGAGHAAVRVRRMRGQLDIARAVVAALDSRPRCPGLTATATGWDGLPSPLWRKRLARHVRDCRACTRAAKGHLAADWLLLGPAMVPVPIALGLGLAAKLGAAGTSIAATASASSAAATGAGAAGAASLHGVAAVNVIGRAIKALAVHPVAAAATAGTLLTGAAITTAVWTAELPPAPRPPRVVATATADRSDDEPGNRRPRRSADPAPVAPPAAQPAATPTPSPSATPTPTPSVTAGGLPIGRVTLEASQFPGRDLMVGPGKTQAELAFPNLNDPASRGRATFDVVPGLADGSCISLRLGDGRYLRHRKFLLEAWQDENTPLFRADATFCPESSAIEGRIRLRSLNYPDRYLRHINFMIQVDQRVPEWQFLADSSWIVRAPIG